MSLVSTMHATAVAQDQSIPNPTTADTGSNSSSQAAIPTLNVQRGNPLGSLFTPQPQFPTAQTIYPQQPAAPAAGELNPLKGLFTPQPQYMTPQAIPNQDGQPADGEVNHLKGMFTPNNQWATPQTVLNPQAVPKALVPERQLLWGSDEERKQLIRQHNMATFGSELPPERAGNSPPAIPPGKQDSGKKQNALSKRPPGKSQPNSSNGALFTGTTAAAPSAADKESAERLRGAITQMRAGKNEDAISTFDRILKDRPLNAEIHYLKAVALVNLRRYQEAAAEYKFVLNDAQPGDKLEDLAKTGLSKLGQ
jgi:hypothetical protein